MTEPENHLQLLNAAMDAIDQGFVVWGDDDRMVLCNQRFRDMWGYSEEVAKPGVLAIDLLKIDAERGEHNIPGADNPDDRAALRDQQAKAHRNDLVDEHYTLKNGRRLFIRRYSVPGLGQISTFTDVTDLKNTEEKLREKTELLEVTNQELASLNAQKDRFFSIIAHDLMSPFNSLLGISQLLAGSAEKMDRADIVDGVQAINASGENLFALLKNLLEWSQLQSDGTAFNPAVLSLNDLIDRNMRLFGPAAEQKNITLTAEIAPGVDAYGDVNAVDTIIRNLVSNALKFTHIGGIVRIAAERTTGGTEMSVSDTGVGIARDKLGRLFDLGENLSSSGTCGETGTGLGLKLCAEFVGKHGGTIDVESTVGKGTKFRVILPPEQNEPPRG